MGCALVRDQGRVSVLSPPGVGVVGQPFLRLSLAVSWGHDPPGEPSPWWWVALERRGGQGSAAGRELPAPRFTSVSVVGRQRGRRFHDSACAAFHVGKGLAVRTACLRDEDDDAID